MRTTDKRRGTALLAVLAVAMTPAAAEAQKKKAKALTKAQITKLIRAEIKKTKGPAGPAGTGGPSGAAGAAGPAGPTGPAGPSTPQTIADGSITTAKLADGSVLTGKIGDNTVTLAKLADDSVGSAEIVDGSVAVADLAPEARTSAAGVFRNAVSGDTITLTSTTPTVVATLTLPVGGPYVVFGKALASATSGEPGKITCDLVGVALSASDTATAGPLSDNALAGTVDAVALNTQMLVANSNPGAQVTLTCAPEAGGVVAPTTRLTHIKIIAVHLASQVNGPVTG
ncbi:hypothetical protein GKE82_21310 [Conexibacter sp. W3-3-2]|uniref:hypothetical protein n=1 Tax=Conexibacter sp. W3-3-2 TaxID=2675227 RepID=UPI0012B73690|nr:hypothetical protein [Conexibacter sp. W3-3-2]MTD46757.1 hypothetical protein [Conexibacter sp. W3-3-2]